MRVLKTVSKLKDGPKYMQLYIWNSTICLHTGKGRRDPQTMLHLWTMPDIKIMAIESWVPSLDSLPFSLIASLSGVEYWPLSLWTTSWPLSLWPLGSLVSLGLSASRPLGPTES